MTYDIDPPVRLWAFGPGELLGDLPDSAVWIGEAGGAHSPLAVHRSVEERHNNRAPLPPLIARGLTLQSGRLPKRVRAGKHSYVNVDAELASLVRDKLGSGVEL